MNVVYIKRVAGSALVFSWLCLAAACSDEARGNHHERTHVEAQGTISSGSATSNDFSEDQSPDNDSAENNDHHGEIRQAGTHLHGKANLAIAVDGKTLVIELESPIYNLTGFEHAPQTRNDQALIEEVEKLLTDPRQLFNMNDEAACQSRPLSKSIDLSMIKTAEHSSGQEHDSGHGGEHHDSHHADHGSDNDDKSGSDHSESHNDVLIEYRFQCASPDALDEISVRLFELFPRIVELDAVFLDQTRQRSSTLNRDNASLKLDQ